MKICSICKGKYTGFGNNARPINAGRCCDTCDEITVIPARISAHFKKLGKKSWEVRKKKLLARQKLSNKSK